LDVIRDELGLHELAIEDVRDSGQRPKVDHYPEHLFVVAYSLEVKSGTSELVGHEINVFVTHNALVTVRADEGFDIDAVVARWDGAPNLTANGVAFLLHGVLDYVADTHFSAIQELDNQIDSLEDQLFDETTTDLQLQRRTFELRKDLVKLRRVVVPMREVVNTLMRRDLGVVTDPMTPYFQDVYDHVLRATEWTESLRDLLANILETRLTVRGNRLNSIMKKVTSWAAIIAVPTAVTGYFGQNLPYPGFQERWGFWLSLSIMLGASAGLYVLFRLKEWL
jgi:magnesium transporter